MSTSNASATIDDLSPGQIINFDLVTTLISGGYYGVKLLAKAGYDLAVSVTDVDSIHASIYDTLPTGTPRRAKDFNYLIIERNGNREAVGIPWIKEPVTVVDSTVFDVQIKGLNMDEGVKLITEALNSRGISDFTIAANGTALR